MASDPMAQDITRCDFCTKSTFTGIAPAEVVCKTCHINLCKACMAEHISSKLSVKHDILGIGFHSPDFRLNLPICLIHDKLQCELNCQECNIPVCSKCLAGPHKKHDVVEISNIFNSKKKVIEKDNEELENIIIPRYEKINAEYETKISSVPRGYDNYRKTINKQGEEMHKIVDIVIRKHLKEAEEMEKEDIVILQKDQSEIRKIQKSAQEIFQDNNKNLQLNDTNKVINYKSRNADFRKVPSKTELSRPSFSTGKISEEMIRKMFGDVTPSMKTEVPVKQFIDQPKSTEIDCGLNEPWRVCCVPDSKQLYVRRQGSNSINHLDNKGKLLNKIRTKSGNKEYINLSVMRNGRLVYSDYRDRSINIVNNDKIDTVIRLQGWKPRTVCCTSSNGLLVTMISHNCKCKVVRYVGSTVTQEIQFDDQGKALYSDPGLIVENKNFDICVIERDLQGDIGIVVVVVVDESGKLKFRYWGNSGNRKFRMFNPQGLATDSQCHILVSNCDNDCIDILNHDGSFLRYIDNCNLNGPTDLSISSDDVLYVVDRTKKVKVIRYLQ